MNYEKNNLIKYFNYVSTNLNILSDTLNKIVEDRKRLLSNINSLLSRLYIPKVTNCLSSIGFSFLKSIEDPHSFASYCNYDEKLGDYHWSFPYYVTIEELHSLLESINNEKEFDDRMLSIFNNDKLFEMIDIIIKTIPKHHVTMLKQIKIGISTNSYLLVNNALLSIIDNCLSIYLENKGRSKRKGIFKPIINVFEKCYINTIPEFYFDLNILSNNIDWLFEDYNFEKKNEIKSNKKIRRHPALHGVKYSNKRIDTIMLLNNLFSLIKIKPYIRVFENSIICPNKEFCLNEKGKINASIMLIKLTIDDILSIDNKFSYKDALECIKEVNIFEKIDSNEKKQISKVLQSLKMKGVIKYKDGYWYKNI